MFSDPRQDRDYKGYGKAKSAGVGVKQKENKRRKGVQVLAREGG